MIIHTLFNLSYNSYDTADCTYIPTYTYVVDKQHIKIESFSVILYLWDATHYLWNNWT